MSNEKIEQFWENATADDVAKIANTRKPIAARVRDEEPEDWREDLISGWRLSRFLPGAIWIDADGVHWKQCQVYREPSWYANKPDPGPGFRLLEKFPDEPKLATDEALQYDGTTWNRVRTGSGVQDPGVWYRRRIEQLLSGHRWLANGDRLESGDLYYEKGALLEVGHEYWGNKVMLTEAFMRKIEPVEPKFAVGRMVRVVGPKGSDAKHWDSEMARHVGTLQTVKYIEGFANPPEIFYGVYGIDSRKFREDYLEAVEPEQIKPVLIRRRAVEIGDEIKLPNGRVLVFNGEGFEVAQ
jgi:hypothetical protein